MQTSPNVALCKNCIAWKLHCVKLEAAVTKFINFLSDDAGAVTIDWVALTAGVLLLAILVVYAIFNNGVDTLVGNINSTLMGIDTTVGVGTVTFDGLQ